VGSKRKMKIFDSVVAAMIDYFFVASNLRRNLPSRNRILRQNVSSLTVKEIRNTPRCLGVVEPFFPDVGLNEICLFHICF
jgi:hypothetical protein